MNIFIILTLTLVVVVSTVNSNPSPLASEKCAFQLDISVPDKINGIYEGIGQSIDFNAYIEENMIYSTTAFYNTANEKQFDTSLSFPFTNHREIPGMLRYVVNAAATVAHDTDCNLPPDISNVYEEFAETLYECTMSIGTSQLRFSLMYQVAVMGTAKRICSKSETMCTPSPAYEFGNELFICSEDIKELFPAIGEQGRQKVQEIQQRSKRHFSESCQSQHPLGWGLHGGDTCCCGNYAGCCVYAHSFCCTHDNICNCCQYGWFCGWQCVPSPGC